MKTAPRLALVLALALSACAGPRPDTDPAPPDTVTYPDETPAQPGSSYDPPAPAPVYPPATTPAPAPAPAPAPVPAPRQVDGFRVQVYASSTAAGSEQKRAEAQAWWAAEQRRTGFVAPLEAYVVNQEGLYKVRMGAFTNRQDAEAALALVRQRFPDAFLTPDRVTIDG